MTWGLLVLGTWGIAISVIAYAKVATSSFGDGDILAGLASGAFLCVQVVLVVAFWRSQLSWASSEQEQSGEEEPPGEESA